ncbi:hypothetical protein M569_04893, partial [Genlisea aurea]
LLLSYVVTIYDEHSSSTGLLNNTKIAVCLVGGARRFELTGPSIVDRILRVYPNADLFLNSPLDSDSYKFLLLNEAPSIATVRLFKQVIIPVTDSAERVLSATASRTGRQGLLQYMSMVEGCIDLIRAHEEKNDFRYDWVIRTRVDGYWSDPLSPEAFVPGKYTIPVGSTYGGLNDRFGLGDYDTSMLALRRFSSIPVIDSAGGRRMSSEAIFMAQLIAQNVDYAAARIPFCIVTDHWFRYPPSVYNSTVMAMSSSGALGGAYCRPCTPLCNGSCAVREMRAAGEAWGTEEMGICDAGGDWEVGWEELFDRAVDQRLATKREEIRVLKFRDCVEEFEKMNIRSGYWDGPSPAQICKMGLK